MAGSRPSRLRILSAQHTMPTAQPGFITGLPNQSSPRSRTGQGDVDGGAVPGSNPDVLGARGILHIHSGRLVHVDEQDVFIVAKHVVRAIAMVYIEIDDADLRVEEKEGEEVK